MSKNRCCCKACEIKDGCVDGGELIHHCCSCLPRRACIKLFTDGDCGVCDPDPHDPYTPSATVEAESVCGGAVYAADLSCDNGNTLIDIAIKFKKVDGVCYICLESVALDYVDHTGAGGDDERVCVAMSYDASEKFAECRAMVYDFPVDLGAVYGCGGTGTIQIRPGEYVGRTTKPTCGHNHKNVRSDWCLCGTACIRYNDGYTTEIVTVCTEEIGYEVDGWVATFGDVQFQILIESTDPLQFRFVPIAGISEANYPLQDVCCYDIDENPACNMSAEWADVGVSIVGNPNDDPNDCLCWCECLCVTYVAGGQTHVTKACWDVYSESWRAESNGQTFSFSFFTIGCNPKRTQILLGTSESILGDPNQDILCPNRIEAFWTIGDGDSVAVECKGCTEDCPAAGVNVPCCNNEFFPANLVATIEDQGGCSNLDGVTIPLTLNILDAADCWTGSRVVPLDAGSCAFHFSMRCGGGVSLSFQGAAADCTGTGLVGKVISCKPVEILFSLPDGTAFPNGCCVDGIFSGIFVRVTE